MKMECRGSTHIVPVAFNSVFGAGNEEGRPQYSGVQRVVLPRGTNILPRLAPRGGLLSPSAAMLVVK